MTAGSRTESSRRVRGSSGPGAAAYRQHVLASCAKSRAGLSPGPRALRCSSFPRATRLRGVISPSVTAGAVPPPFVGASSVSRAPPLAAGLAHAAAPPLPARPAAWGGPRRRWGGAGKRREFGAQRRIPAGRIHFARG